MREINYSGGEPLLKDNFEKILTLGKRLGFKQLVSTNTTLIDEKWARTLVRTCDVVFISLEGPKDIDEAIRGEGHFDKALKAIKMLEHRKKGIVSIGVTIAKYNVNSLEELCKLCIELGISMGFQLISPYGVAFPRLKAEGHKSRFNYEDIKKVASCIVKYRSCFSASDEYYQALLKTLSGVRVRPCVVAYRRLTIDPRGYIYPCSLWPKYVGHIREGVLNVWFSSVFEEERLKMRKCMSCFLGCYEPDSITYEMLPQRIIANVRKALVNHQRNRGVYIC